MDSIDVDYTAEGWLIIDVTKAVKSWQLDYHANQGKVCYHCMTQVRKGNTSCGMEGASPYLVACLECINPKIFFLRPHGGDTSKGQPKHPIALDNCWIQGEQGGEEGPGGIHGRLFQELR